MLRIYAFNYNLNDENYEEIVNRDLRRHFFNCIHIKNNIGAFIYLTSTNDYYYLNLIFRNYDKNTKSFLNYLTEVQYPLDTNDLNHAIDHNFIKYSENKICFIISTLQDINKLKIYLINLYFKKK